MKLGMISVVGVVLAIFTTTFYIPQSFLLRAEDNPSPEQNLNSVEVDSIIPDIDASIRYTALSDSDFQKVANQLNIEVAALKAVAVVEAGAYLKGFWAPGYPVINYDKAISKSCTKLVKNVRKDPASTVVPKEIPAGFPHKAWQKLINARKINRELADLSTFWGMFQIGGFNFRQCGCKSIEEFVELQSFSELQQLEIFATLIENSGLTKYLRNKDWAGFASRYNGPSYARRGYHTKMAAAYRKFK